MERHNDISPYLDYKQMDVGGDDSWSSNSMVLPLFRLNDRSYSYQFRLRAIGPDDDVMKLNRRQFDKK